MSMLAQAPSAGAVERARSVLHDRADGGGVQHEAPRLPRQMRSTRRGAARSPKPRRPRPGVGDARAARVTVNARAAGFGWGVAEGGTVGGGGGQRAVSVTNVVAVQLQHNLCGVCGGG